MYLFSGNFLLLEATVEASLLASKSTIVVSSSVLMALVAVLTRLLQSIERLSGSGSFCWLFWAAATSAAAALLATTAAVLGKVLLEGEVGEGNLWMKNKGLFLKLAEILKPDDTF